LYSGLCKALRLMQGLVLSFFSSAV